MPAGGAAVAAHFRGPLCGRGVSRAEVLLGLEAGELGALQQAVEERGDFGAPAGARTECDQCESRRLTISCDRERPATPKLPLAAAAGWTPTSDLYCPGGLRHGS